MRKFGVGLVYTLLVLCAGLSLPLVAQVVPESFTAFISGAPTVASPTGSELVPIITGGVTKSTTTAALAAPILSNSHSWSGVQSFAGTVVARRTLNSNTTLCAVVAGLCTVVDNVVCGDVSGGAVILTMPTNVLPNGFTLAIDDCKRQSATHNLTIAANGGQTISGAASVIISTNGGSINAVWNSTDSDWNLF